MKKLLFLIVPLLLTSCGLKQPEDDIIDFSLSANKTTLKVGEIAKVTISLKDEKESANFTYKSSDDNILKPIGFTNNVISVSAVNLGNATITVTETKFKTSKSIDFNVNTIDIKLNRNSLVFVKGDAPFQLSANVTDVTWESDNESVATVSNTGLVTAIDIGQATITVRHNIVTSCFATCSVVVTDEYVPEKITMRQNYKDYGDNLYWEYHASTSSTGVVNLLIIPVWFNDSSDYIKTNDNPLYKQYVREDIETAYLGSNEKVGYRSVKTYYEEESGGKLTINGTVTDWYDTGDNSSIYGYDSSSTRTLARKAAAWARDNQGIDLTEYDVDKDGYLDGVILIYACPDYSVAPVEREDMDNFWAYCGHDTYIAPDVDNPTSGVYFWASYDFMYGGDDRYPYTLERTGSWYGNGNPYRQLVDTATFIHEMGHMFGLYDYYDYNYGINQRTPAGKYTMQDENVSTHDPFSYIALNWADPYIPTKTCTITIGDFATTHDVILLTPEWNSYDSPFDEYILLELYSLTGLNEYYKDDWFQAIELPDGIGIRVWHIDARLLSYPTYGYSESRITSDATASGTVFKLCDNSYYQIGQFPSDQRGSFICKHHDMLQLISHTPTRNYANLRRSGNHFNNNDLFYEGDTFTLDAYKKQFIDMTDLEFYTDGDTDIKLNNKKKLNWSFTVNDITTKNDGSSTATIALTKLA